MAPLLAAAEGLHQVRFASLAEGAVYFTLTQRSTQWFAAARKRRIAAERGPRAVVDGVSYVAFPTLATIAATPCTAPFMGSALGFALGQPAAMTLLVFTALGLGMATPYLSAAALMFVAVAIAIASLNSAPSPHLARGTNPEPRT